MTPPLPITHGREPGASRGGWPHAPLPVRTGRHGMGWLALACPLSACMGRRGQGEGALRTRPFRANGKGGVACPSHALFPHVQGGAVKGGREVPGAACPAPPSMRMGREGPGVAYPCVPISHVYKAVQVDGGVVVTGVSLVPLPARTGRRGGCAWPRLRVTPRVAWLPGSRAPFTRKQRWGVGTPFPLPRPALSPLHESAGAQRVEGTPSGFAHSPPVRETRGEGWGSACPDRVTVLHGREGGAGAVPLLCAHGFPTCLGGMPPDLRSVPPPSAPLSAQRAKGGDPIPFACARPIFCDPSFRAPPRGEREQWKGEAGGVSGALTGRGRGNAGGGGVGANAICGPPHFAAPVGVNGWGRGSPMGGGGGRRSHPVHSRVTPAQGWEGTPLRVRVPHLRGQAAKRRGAVPRELAFASCLRVMNKGAGGRGEAYLSHAPFCT
ncbi:hypothetical protein EDB89DRAFT_1902672 [Lactarius sanguifluus]|nr:hypothetical protein EDB89DRAFT_1902672 [Lactarius sanguifluus]